MYMGGSVALKDAAVWLIAHDKIYSNTDVHHQLNAKMLSVRILYPIKHQNLSCPISTTFTFK